MRIAAVCASLCATLFLCACPTTSTTEPEANPDTNEPAATAEPAEPEPPTPECTSDDDCADGQRCEDDQCLTPSSSGDTFLCSNDDPCPAGQFCFNGLCAIGCLSNGDCADDQYCDTEGSMRCVNKTPQTCPDVACEANQECVEGYCVVVDDDTTCTPSPDGNDGCDDYSVCLDHSDVDAEEPDYRCTQFPACGEDGSCPTSGYGALCNDGHIPGKARICLTGLCEDAAEHCPSSSGDTWTCVDLDAGGIGACSDGSFGMMCETTASNCEDGLTCTPLGPTGPGICFGDVPVPSPEPNPEPGEPDVPPADLCDENAPCPDGQFCLNGLCAIGCLSNGDCADDQYCDTEGTQRCVNRVVEECPAVPCAENQECVDGLCVTVTTQSCTPTFDGNDGCDEYSLCLDHSDVDDEEPDYRCTSMPPCPEDGVCPTGGFGAVCNDGYLDGKARFCMSGLCATQDHCADGVTCIDLPGDLGACSDGSFGMMCTSTQDVCDDGLSCMELVPGEPGFCSVGGGGPGDGDTCFDLGGVCTDAFDCDGFPIFGDSDCSISEVCCPM